MNIYTLEVFIISSPIDLEFVKKNQVITHTWEIRGDQTLKELHNTIFKVFNRFDDLMYEFQVGGKDPNDPKARRYGLSPLDDEIMGSKLAGNVQKTVMDDLKLKKESSSAIGSTLATIGGIRSM